MLIKKSIHIICSSFHLNLSMLKYTFTVDFVPVSEICKNHEREKERERQRDRQTDRQTQ